MSQIEPEVSFFTRYRKIINGNIGIEIEVEPKKGKTLPIINRGCWETKDENSLRNGGKEYVTKSPLLYDKDYSKNINELTASLNEKEVEVNSFRTSVHVHLNMTQKTLNELWTIITCYWLMENLLFKYCGEDRENNHFCLRLKDAEGVIKLVDTALEYSSPFCQFIDSYRYGGLNLSALYKFGSLEFRGMRGSVSEGEIRTWSSALYEMSELSTTFFRSPQEVLDYYYNNSVDKIIDMLFPLYLNKFLKSLDKKKDLVDENAYRLLGIAYKHNWNSYAMLMQKCIANQKKSSNSYYARMPNFL